MFSKGLIQPTRVESPQQQNKFCLGYLATHDKRTTGKFNYTILFMRHYLHLNKLNEKSISLKEFVQRVEQKYRLESIN